jgi:hypothetical protein
LKYEAIKNLTQKIKENMNLIEKLILAIIKDSNFSKKNKINFILKLLSLKISTIVC